MLSPHPPQIHSFLRSLGRLASEHPQEASWPSRHPREMLWTTPAEATALAKAASFEAESSFIFIVAESFDTFEFDDLRMERMGPKTVESSTVEQFHL